MFLSGRGITFDSFTRSKNTAASIKRLTNKVRSHGARFEALAMELFELEEALPEPVAFRIQSIIARDESILCDALSLFLNFSREQDKSDEFGSVFEFERERYNAAWVAATIFISAEVELRAALGASTRGINLLLNYFEQTTGKDDDTITTFAFRVLQVAIHENSKKVGALICEREQCGVVWFKNIVANFFHNHYASIVLCSLLSEKFPRVKTGVSTPNGLPRFGELNRKSLLAFTSRAFGSGGIGMELAKEFIKTADLLSPTSTDPAEGLKTQLCCVRSSESTNQLENDRAEAYRALRDYKVGEGRTAPSESLMRAVFRATNSARAIFGMTERATLYERREEASVASAGFQSATGSTITAADVNRSLNSLDLLCSAEPVAKVLESCLAMLSAPSFERNDTADRDRDAMLWCLREQVAGEALNCVANILDLLLKLFSSTEPTAPGAITRWNGPAGLQDLLTSLCPALVMQLSKDIYRPDRDGVACVPKVGHIRLTISRILCSAMQLGGFNLQNAIRQSNAAAWVLHLVLSVPGCALLSAQISQVVCCFSVNTTKSEQVSYELPKDAVNELCSSWLEDAQLLQYCIISFYSSPQLSQLPTLPAICIIRNLYEYLDANKQSNPHLNEAFVPFCAEFLRHFESTIENIRSAENQISDPTLFRIQPTIDQQQKESDPSLGVEARGLSSEVSMVLEDGGDILHHQMMLRLLRLQAEYETNAQSTGSSGIFEFSGLGKKNRKQSKRELSTSEKHKLPPTTSPAIAIARAFSW